MLWRTLDHARYFLIPEGRQPVSGDVAIVDLGGVTARASSAWLAPFEVTETQARRVARDELGQTLGEIRGAIDEKLAKYRARLDAIDRTPVSRHGTVTPGAIDALLDLLKELPRAIGLSLSGEDARVRAARESMASVQQRLEDAGIDVGDHLAQFPDRLSALRRPDPDRDPNSA